MKLFNILKSKKKPIKEIPLTYEEYFSRFQRIKTIIESDEHILKNIENIFRHEYLKEALTEEIIELGSGLMHTVYSIQLEPIVDNEKELFLALRLGNQIPYKLSSDEEINYNLLSELGSFCENFVQGKNPAYFTGLVAWTGSDEYKHEVAGFITQDLTRRKTLKARTERKAFQEYMIITDEKGKEESHFIDATMPNGFRSEVMDYKRNIIHINHS